MKVINLYGNIGYNWWTGEGITAQSFAKDFDAAVASGEDIEVRINSPGGSVFEGIAIYNKIAANNEKVTTVVDGIAYSMGGVIAMAGKKRKAMKNATIMIHNVSGGAVGNANDLRGALEMMDKLDDSLCESIAQFTGTDAAVIKTSYFDYRDHTLTAKEALEAKLFTEIIDLNAENVPANLTAMSKEDLFAHYAKFNTPKEQKGFLAEFIQEIRNGFGSKPPIVNEPIPTPTPQQPEDMKMIINKSMTAVAAALAISFAENETEQEVELTAEHVNQLNSALNAANATATDATAKVTALTTERDALQAKVNALPAAPPSAPPARDKPEGEGEVKENEFLSDADAKMKELRAAVYGEEKK